MLFTDHGLSPAQISILFVIWSTTAFVLEVPSGAWADTYSRRKLLVLGALLSGLGYAAWITVPSFAGFALGFVLWALSGALTSGTFEALAYDELTAAGAGDAYVRVIGHGTTLSLLGMTVATLAAFPLVALGGIGLTLWVSVGVCAVQLAVVRSLPPAPPQRSPDADDESGPDAAGTRVWSAYVRALRTGVSEAVRHGGVRTAVLAGAGLMGLLAFDEYFGLLLDERGASVAAVPLWLVLVAVAQAGGGALASRAVAWPAGAFTALVALSGATLAGGALIDHPAGIAAIAAGYGALQLTIVVADVRLQDRIESGARATVTSVTNVLAELLAVAVYVAVGVGAPHTGYGVMLAAIAVLLALSARRCGAALGRPRDAAAVRHGGRSGAADTVVS